MKIEGNEKEIAAMEQFHQGNREEKNKNFIRINRTYYCK